ncbi:MAG: Rid family hydrolase [Acidimicrobiia bacterium]
MRIPDDNRIRISSGSPYEDRVGFSRAIRVAGRVHVAGTAPIPQDGSTPPESPYDQMLLCGQIVATALAAAGASLADVVRTRMFIADASYADDVAKAHREVFAQTRPAATMVITQLLDPAWTVEIEVEAAV